MGKALAVTFADVDRDGFLDAFVANDTVQNFAFRNMGDGTFKESGAASGIGFDATYLIRANSNASDGCAGLGADYCGPTVPNSTGANTVSQHWYATPRNCC